MDWDEAYVMFLLDMFFGDVPPLLNKKKIKHIII